MSATYSTIKELVIDAYISEDGMPEYEPLTAMVMKHFPNSKWKKTHYAWYKSKIKHGEIPIERSLESEGEEAPINESDLESEVEESIETRVSLERDLHDYLGRRLEKIEPGLKLFKDGIEFITEVGRIDILATDIRGNLVVLELKAGMAKDAALGQILGYMGSVAKMKLTDKSIRGILVASEFDPRVVLACSALPNIQIFKYQMNFEFGEVK